jgi:hypothetical protein
LRAAAAVAPTLKLHQPAACQVHIVAPTPNWHCFVVTCKAACPNMLV